MERYFQGYGRAIRDHGQVGETVQREVYNFIYSDGLIISILK